MKILSVVYLLIFSSLLGFELADIQLCVSWLQPFSAVINTQGRPAMLKYFKGVSLMCVFHTWKLFLHTSSCCVIYCVGENFQYDTYLFFLSAPQISPQDTHNIQVHDVAIHMLEEVSELRQFQERQMEASLSPFMECSVFLTPPRQERRCLAPLNSTTV